MSALPTAVPVLRRAVVAAVIEPGDNPSLGPEVALVASELVTNVVRHAYPQGAGDVEVEAWRSNGEIRLLVRDWGNGPSNDSVPGLGLTIVRELASSMDMRQSDCVEMEARLGA